MASEEILRRMLISRDVIGAVILRDMRTRFGRSHYSYLVALMWPYLHVLILVTAYKLLGRAAPLGTEPATYFALAVIPFIFFVYPMRQLSTTVAHNKPLLNFPRVKVLDLIAARIILESVTAAAVCIIVFGSLVLVGYEFDPYDYALLIGAFAAALYLGIALGTAWALICAIWPGAAIVAQLTVFIAYLTSGIIFLPDLLPDQVRRWVALNPLLHSVELARTAYYPDFFSQTLDTHYLFWFPTTVLFIALVGLMLFKRFVVAK